LAIATEDLGAQFDPSNDPDEPAGLVLIGRERGAALRCAPPHNKPTPQELRNCFPYVVEEFDALARLRVAIGLGSIGFAAILKALRERGFTFDSKAPKFAHAAEATASNATREIVVLASYHPSRQNTNTGVLTVPMFDAIFTRARAILDRG
ncbi:MAG: uracil-DNA glycosylase family protein, partial [Candidatus Tumulicola sp.]